MEFCTTHKEALDKDTIKKKLQQGLEVHYKLLNNNILCIRRSNDVQFLMKEPVDHHFDSVDKIKIKMDGVSQSLNYSLLDRKNENSQVTFDGYTKTDSSRDPEIALRYYGEDYKLFVLYYGGQLLAKKDDIMSRFNNSITNRLAEQKGDKATQEVM